MATVDFILGWVDDASFFDLMEKGQAARSVPRVLIVMALDRHARNWGELAVESTGESSWARGFVGDFNERIMPILDRPAPTSILLRWPTYFPRPNDPVESHVGFAGPYETEAFGSAGEAVELLLERALQMEDPLEGLDVRRSTRPVDPADIPP